MSEHVHEIDISRLRGGGRELPVPVVLDFYSTECPPCEALAPKFEAAAEQFAGKARFLKVIPPGQPRPGAAARRHRQPTLLFFKGGEEVGERLTGEEIKRSELKARSRRW